MTSKSFQESFTLQELLTQEFYTAKKNKNKKIRGTVVIFK